MPKQTLPIYEDNPFPIEGIKSKWRNLEAGEYLVSREDTGEAFIQRELKTAQVEVDTLPYTKFFHSLQDIVSELTTTETKILMYIFKVLKPNKNEVTLQVQKCIEYCGWTSANNFYLGARQLIDHKIIAKSVKGNTTYWINANLLFNGDRKKIN